MNLTLDLRDDIYRLVFIKKDPIDFNNRIGFCHSSALLRVNKAVYMEARYVLYGRNRFLWGHSGAKTGSYSMDGMRLQTHCSILPRYRSGKHKSHQRNRLRI